MRFPPLTTALMVLSITVSLASGFSARPSVLAPLFISTEPGFLSEVAGGQIWRLWTPIFIHGSFLHLGFNMLWLWELGGALERRLGTLYLGGLICGLALVSNLAQFYFVHPWFGGMSGVVYGLFGYFLIQGRANPRFGMSIHQPIVLMMLVWFVICWVGVIGNVANVAHTAGLLVGAAWGFVDARRERPG